MKQKTEIFRDVVGVMTKDYAGYFEKKHLNHPENYVITDDMDDIEFLQTIQSYLLDFRDGHLSFNMKNKKTAFKGFRVRRYENALYVTELHGEQRLQIGDKIVALDGVSIEQFEKVHSKILKDQVPERQYWNVALSNVNSIKVHKDNQLVEYDLEEYDSPSYTPEYSFRQLDSQTVYIKITDFMQSEPIQNLVADNEQALNEAQNLIIDVRMNYGGSDLFYFPLLDYIFERKIPVTEFFQQDEVMYTNYTENNCNLRIAVLNEFLAQPLDAETKAQIEEEIRAYSLNKGKGLLIVEEEWDYVINGRPVPANVYILSDTMCGSSGDTFVKHTKKSPKVTVVGRATMGIIDYCNVATKDYGDYKFGYSVSKMNDKYHCNETGVLPDIHIPWTPKHLEEDVDLNYVLNLCNTVHK